MCQFVIVFSAYEVLNNGVAKKSLDTNLNKTKKNDDDSNVTYCH